MKLILNNIQFDIGMICYQVKHNKLFDVVLIWFVIIVLAIIYYAIAYEIADP